MDTEFVNQVIQVLANAGSPSNEVQQQVMRAVDQMSSRPDFAGTLGYLLATPNCASTEIRQRAGLLLKTALSRGTASGQSPGVRDMALRGIADPEAVIRRTASSIITTSVTSSPNMPCSDILAGLTGMLFGQPTQLMEGAFDAIFKISEDVIDLWRQSALSGGGDDQNGPKILLGDFMQFADSQLMPQVFKLSSVENKLKLLNLFATNFLFFPNHPLSKHLTPYFECLGQLAATESAPGTVSQICKGLGYIARHHPDMFGGSLMAVVGFMLTASKHPDASVRLDALQFWPVATTNGDWIPHLEPVLPELLPVLLENMVYSQEDYLAMDEAVLLDDNAAVPDRPEEMAPRFHKEKDTEEDDAGTDEDEDNEINSTWGSEWTVRKAAASALDHIATSYRDAILPSILPVIERKLGSDDWEIQESALLALGAIGHGCLQGLGPHLPSILQLLVSISKSRKPLLRSISCWTISRFATWIAFDTHRPTALPLALSVILSRMMDHNKRVQEAAVSAFVSLEEEAGMYMEPYLGDIVKAICAAMNYYQSKNLLILLDAVACLFESLGSEVMSKPEIVDALVPPIVEAFRRTQFNSEKQLSVSLFECMTAITACIGPGVGVEALNTIVTRCGSVLETNVSLFKRITVSMSTEDKPDGDILACSLDLLCGVIDGLADASLNLISKMNFTPLLCELISGFDTSSRLPLIRNYYSNTVKQCAFALLGDVAKSCVVLLSDDLVAPIIPVVVSYVTLGPILVSNNSSWCLGELCMRKSYQSLEPFVDSIALALLTNLKRFEVGSRPIIRQNAAIALGRLAMVASQRLIANGAFVEMFCTWCNVMKKMRTDGEKLTAVKGFTICVEASPQTAMSAENIRALCELVASLFPPPSTLEASLRGIILMYRELLGDSDWGTMWSTFPAELQYRLNHAYALGMNISQPPPPRSVM